MYTIYRSEIIIGTLLFKKIQSMQVAHLLYYIRWLFASSQIQFVDISCCATII